METKITPKRFVLSSDLSIILLGVGASLAGSLSMRFGGFIISGVTAIIIGLLSFLILRRKSQSSLNHGEPTENPLQSISTIPDDRVDQLTGLANENGLMAWFLEKSSQKEAAGQAILILTADLADFAQVEKTYGKNVADAVLIEIAKRITQCTGHDGIAARTLQEGFAAIASIVPSTEENVAAKQAGKLAELIQRPVELATGVVWIGGFVGAATGSVKDGQTVLQNARKALKQAKIQGRGHYKVYNADKQE